MKTKLCLATMSSLPLTVPEQIRLFHKTGWHGFFTNCDPEVDEYRRLADELGMIYQSIHAPFDKAKRMWEEDADDAVRELVDCVHACARVRVPLLIVHVYIGFDPSDGPTQAGLDHYATVVAEAKKCGVRIAFENTEGEQYLTALMARFAHEPHVGFCWDAGHELCYNLGKDMLALYGDRLFGTHLNDNLGVRGESIFWHDDLHLLPFDGIRDWDEAMARLVQHGYNGELTFELTTASKPNRHDNDKYAALSPEVYVAEAYARACRVAALYQRHLDPKELL